MKRKFKFPKGCNISEAVIRETTGEDEAFAVQMVKSQGEKGMMLDELINMSLVSIDGAAVEQPFNGLKKWNSKTRSLIMKAYLSLNSADDKEEKDFLSESEPA